MSFAPLRNRIIRAGKIFKDSPCLFLVYLQRELLKLNKLKPEFPAIIEFGEVLFELPSYDDNNLVEMYFRTYEISTEMLMRRYLRKGGVFVDIGANIGYFSAMAMNMVGSEGEVHSFEPLGLYFKSLQRLKELNPNHRLIINNFALGDKECEALINVSNFDIGSNTMVDMMLDENLIKETQIVSVQKFDDYYLRNHIERIDLIKIDVEGYEMCVFMGMVDYLSNCRQQKPPIICEITPSAYTYKGQGFETLFNYLKIFGYQAYSEFNPGKKLSRLPTSQVFNVIFLHSSK